MDEQSEIRYNYSMFCNNQVIIRQLQTIDNVKKNV